MNLLDWINSLQQSITYIESHLEEELNVKDVANTIQMSPYHFQHGFQLITGYSITEYIRCRRLYLAALLVLTRQKKIIDIAYTYRYSTPDSFTKAFRRFHGISPIQLRDHPEKLRIFLPLKIKLTIQGGEDMDYIIEKVDSFQVIGLATTIPFSSAYQKIPAFWNEYCQIHCQQLQKGLQPTTAIEQAVYDYKIGTYGICLDDLPQKETFRYLIAGIYTGGQIPAGMVIANLPALTWAKFRCTGPMPTSLQALNTRIYEEWLPNNPEYEISTGISLEMYSTGDIYAANYMSEIWIPIKYREK